MVKYTWFIKAGILAATLLLAGCMNYTREVREYDNPPAVYVAPATPTPAAPPVYRYEYEHKTERNSDRDTDKSDTSGYYYREYRRESVQ